MCEENGDPLDKINAPSPYHAFVAYLACLAHLLGELPDDQREAALERLGQHVDFAMLESGENMSLEKRSTLRSLHAKFLQMCRDQIP